MECLGSGDFLVNPRLADVFRSFPWLSVEDSQIPSDNQTCNSQQLNSWQIMVTWCA